MLLFMPYKDMEKKRLRDLVYGRKWQNENPDKVKRYQETYYQKHKEARLESHRDWLARNPEYLRTYNKNNSEKYRARYAVRNAIAAGKLAKPKHCFQCSARKKLHAHHHLGYSKKHQLSVIWLCIPCHAKIHYSFRNI